MLFLSWVRKLVCWVHSCRFRASMMVELGIVFAVLGILIAGAVGARSYYIRSSSLIVLSNKIRMINESIDPSLLGDKLNIVKELHRQGINKSDTDFDRTDYGFFDLADDGLVFNSVSSSDAVILARNTQSEQSGNKVIIVKRYA